MPETKKRIPRELCDATKEPYVIDEFISPEHERHDPSNIIRYDDKYYVWFTEHTKASFGYDTCYVMYATSTDGCDWRIEGKALSAGGPGDWDERYAYTAHVVPHDGKYYLFYTGKRAESSKPCIGYAVADTPEGPCSTHNAI